MDTYFMIVRGEDAPYILSFTKDKLEKALSEDYADYSALFNLDSIDLMHFPSTSYFIIKGKNILPRRVEVVTKFEV